MKGIQLQILIIINYLETINQSVPGGLFGTLNTSRGLFGNNDNN